MIDLPLYTLSQRVYEGSETVLYRGHRDADGAPVAIKMTRSEYPTARELGRLRREFGVLEHIGDLPGVGRAYALEKCGRGLALVMEDLGPRSLNDLLRTRKLDVRTALQIAISLADTLSLLHRRHVIHKDIKPHNIMIDEGTMAPRFVDFGIAARLSQETQRATSPATLEGTLAYMSPEQTGRMNRVVDLRTDLYSLGATLFEVLTGVVPFPEADPLELIHSHIARTPTPPHEREPSLPEALSSVVMRLLSKTPEERYQSARGLKADLEECLTQWKAAEQITPFPLGRYDTPDELRIPQQLYGREREVEALLLAFERARKGAVELVLVSGYSGVGKSALVSEIHKPIARQGGYFIRGKFDQISRDVPLAPVVHAFRELLQQILTEPASALEKWKGELLDAVGANGRLLVELVPEIELILGPQPEVPALGPAEAKNRFGLLVQRFLRVFTKAAHPLALFLDDLQWADAASLQMLSLLLSDPDSKHLAIIGAYRDNEVDAAHPLMSTLAELRKAGAGITELTLTPLDLPKVNELIADTLRARASDVSPLAALVFDKTHGNPFFVGQLLRALHEEQILELDPSSGVFVWDQERVRGVMVTDNVVDLMVGKLKRLPEGAQRALAFAACVGDEFDLGALSTIAERSPAAVAAELWAALSEGLIEPLDGEYRLLDVSAGSVSAPSAAELHISYRFLHDRMREAAYSLIEAERKAEVHLSIGRLLWARSGRRARDEDLLEILRHLNQGALGSDGAEPSEERVELAQLNLRAGRKARAATAYAAAASYFSAGVALLGQAGWERSYERCLALHTEHAECAYLSGAVEQAEALFEALLPRVRSSLERARIHDMRLVLYVSRGKFTDAVRVGLEGLALLGVTLPEPAEQEAAFGEGLAEVAANLGDRSIKDLIDAPRMDDPERRVSLQLLCDLSIPLFMVTPRLYPLVVLKQVSLSLRHGHSDLSALGYMVYGSFLANMLDQPAKGYAFGSFALALNDKLQNAPLSCRLELVFAGFFFLTEPAHGLSALMRRARATALESGDLVYFSFILCTEAAIRFGLGDQLEDLREEVDRSLVGAQRVKNAMPIGVLTVVKQAIAGLQGRTRGRTSLSDDGFDEETFRAKLDPKSQPTIAAYYHMFKLHLLYLHGDHAGAAAAAEEAQRLLSSIVGFYSTRFDLYAGLALLALPPAAEPEEEERRAQAIAGHRARLARRAASCPGNFEHLRLMVEAEVARREGKPHEAIDLCDRAIALAKESGFSHEEALANELCGKLYLGIGKAKPARPYLADAHLGYLHWGATAKAEDLSRDHGALLPSPREAERRKSTTTSTTVSSATLLHGTTISSLREAAVVVRAVQVIAGELMLPQVIERLAKLVLENAGAQRGALLLLRDGRLFVDATFGGDPAVIAVGPSVALDTHRDLAQSVPLFVTRTREPVVLDDAAADRRFAGDPYLALGLARSILCLPLIHQGRLSGLIYLEHRELTAAFNEARVELLSLLSSQAAIAIENARLLSDVRAANGEVQRSNGRLEGEVAARTEELQRVNRELGATNQRLQVELRQRERAEQEHARAERERAEIQDQMLQAQRARLLELSTPLIPITDHIMVMPIIGTVDAERAEQVLEVALTGARQHRARVVILDITGVRHIDTHVVGTFLRTASALRLLGVQVVLTGIGPDVAQTIVALGVDLGSIVTRGTLRGGIAYALKRAGEGARR